MRLLLLLLIWALMCAAHAPTDTTLDSSTSPPTTLPQSGTSSPPLDISTSPATTKPLSPSLSPHGTTQPPGTELIFVTGGVLPPPPPPPPPPPAHANKRWIITVLTSVCVPINVTFTLWASWISIPPTRIVLETYPGCPILTKRTNTNVLKMYILLDDGTLTSKLGSLINARGGNNIISASVSLEKIAVSGANKGGSSLVLVITIVASAVTASLLLAAAVLGYVFYRLHHKEADMGYSPT